MQSSSTSKHRTVPLQETISCVDGYPKKLKIFQIPASSFWWVRYYSQTKVFKKSTKTTNKSEAIAFAKKFYEKILLAEWNLLPVKTSATFEQVALLLIDEQEHLINRGERSERLNINDRQKLKKDILPYFGSRDIKTITYRDVNTYLNKVSADRGISPTTLKSHLNLIHKILAVAEREGIIERTPRLPSVKRNETNRTWFNEDDYKKLVTVAQHAASKRQVVRCQKITGELPLLIEFMTNTFLRPSDVKDIRHRNIEIIKSNQTYLRIQTDTSKTVKTPVVSLEPAVSIYNQLIDFHQSENNPHDPDDFLFLPTLKNRTYAMETLRRNFDAVLLDANLKKAGSGETRTLYSLRHTAIMFRLTQGDQIDLLTLARNCRTSVQMIDKFYAKPLSAEMNVDLIQSMRKQHQESVSTN